MAIYARISNGIVLDVQLLDDVSQQDPAFIWVDLSAVNPHPEVGWSYDGVNFIHPGLPNDAYSNKVTFSTNGVKDTYVIDGSAAYQFPAGTPQPAAYLAIAKKENLLQFQSEVQEYVGARYSLDVRFNLNALYQLSLQQGLTNRAAYITQLFTWAQGIVTYASTYTSSVMAMTKGSDIAAAKFDSTQMPVDPLVSSMTAIGILN